MSKKYLQIYNVLSVPQICPGTQVPFQFSNELLNQISKCFKREYHAFSSKYIVHSTRGIYIFPKIIFSPLSKMRFFPKYLTDWGNIIFCVFFLLPLFLSISPFIFSLFSFLFRHIFSSKF